MSACMDRTNLLVRATSLWFMSKDSQRTAFPLATALCVVLAGLAVSEPVRADSFDEPLDASAQQAYEPTFSEEVQVLSQRIVGEKHLALKLKHQGEPVDGIWFGHTDPLPAKVTMAFRLGADEWNGVRRVKFFVEAVQG